MDGLCCAHPGISRIKDTRVVVNRNRVALARTSPELVSPVAIITGGGSGHEPFAAGYVGNGLLTASVAGSVFASPPVGAVVTAITAAAAAAKEGVLVIVINYTGDRLHFGRAVEKCRAKGIKVEMFISGDDSAMTTVEGTAGRRGLCGTMFLLKIVGALADNGASLEELSRVCHEISLQYSTVGAAASGCTLPGNNAPLFNVPDGLLELGLGVHGEAGVRLLKRQNARELVRTILDHMMAAGSASNVAFKKGDRLAVIVNNLGTMTQMEILIIVNEVHTQLVARGFTVMRLYSDVIMTSLDMRGFHVSLLRLTDHPEWVGLLDAPTSAPAWPHPFLAQDGTMGGQEIEQVDQETLHVAELVQYRLSPDQAQLMKTLLQGLAKAVLSWRDALNELDSGCGDGDCGSTLCLGANKLALSLDTMPCEQPVLLLHQLADIAGEAMGGTSGGIYSILLSVMANTLQKLALKAGGITKSAEAGGTSPSGPKTVGLGRADWVQAFEDGLKAVSKYGGAKKGYRTMLDALYPACAAAREVPSAAKTSVLLRTMAIAADKGATSTKDMKASAGRASYVRSGDVQKEDAGARAAANILLSMAQSAESGKQ